MADEPDDLQFSTVEPAAPMNVGGPSCAACKNPIQQSYFTVGDQLLCPACRERVSSTFGRSSPTDIALALGMGTLAAIAGAAVWFAVRYFLNLNLSLIAIAVGWMVGTAVLKGSHGRGGQVFQVLAVLLTYLAICLNYLPDEIAREDLAHKPIVDALINSVQHALPRPFSAARTPIGWLIIGFGLWEAWKLNTPRRLIINGPFAVGGSGPPTVPAAERP